MTTEWNPSVIKVILIDDDKITTCFAFAPYSADSPSMSNARRVIALALIRDGYIPMGEWRIDRDEVARRFVHA